MIEKVRTTSAPCLFSANKPVYEIHAPGSQRIFKAVKSDALDIGMVVNDSKTQLLCIHPAGKSMTTFIKPGESQTIKSEERLKILGFTFGATPDVSVFINLLIRKFNSQLWAMRFLKRSGMKGPDLLTVYKSVVRPTIDFASVTYHSILSDEQSNSVERLQMRAMKLACGETVSYRTVLESKEVESLKERRKACFEKFAKKAAENSRIKDKWFPLNTNTRHELRRREKYFLPRLRTERAKKSPIIQMRRFLNSLQ